MDGKEYLEHFGVMGMRWGVRRAGGVGTRIKTRHAEKTNAANIVKAGHTVGSKRRTEKVKQLIKVTDNQLHKLEKGKAKAKTEADKQGYQNSINKLAERRKIMSDTLAKRESKAASKLALKNERKKAKILNSATKLYKNREKFNQDEINAAMSKMKWERDLRSLSRDEISTGAQYANTILQYAGVATATYGVIKSPLGQAVAAAVKK